MKEGKKKLNRNRVIGKKNEKLKSGEMEWKKMCRVSYFLLLIFSSNRKLRSKNIGTLQAYFEGNICKLLAYKKNDWMA